MLSIMTDRFGFLNFGHCDLPFDFAQGGELVEPFVICVLPFDGLRVVSMSNHNLIFYSGRNKFFI
jgi:hypothetical protein